MNFSHLQIYKQVPVQWHFKSNSKWRSWSKITYNRSINNLIMTPFYSSLPFEFVNQNDCDCTRTRGSICTQIIKKKRRRQVNKTQIIKNKLNSTYLRSPFLAIIMPTSYTRVMGLTIICCFGLNINYIAKTNGHPLL